MKVTHLLQAATARTLLRRSIPLVTSFTILWSLPATTALASPEIASGDGVINADIAACLYRTDAFIKTLDINVERGQIDRTGYLEDGSFRILCYPNPYGQHDQSLVIVFAAHNTNFNIADTFVQIAISEIADQ